MINRPRRLRANSTIRDLVRETSLSPNDFIYPIFVVEGTNITKEIQKTKWATIIIGRNNIRKAKE